MQTIREWFFWVQGPRELLRIETFTPKQLVVIFRHAQLVLECDNSPREGILWKFLLKFVQLFELGDGTPILFSAAYQERLWKEFENCFKHDIDPSAGDENVQAKLNQTHFGMSAEEFEAAGRPRC